MGKFWPAGLEQQKVWPDEVVFANDIIIMKFWVLLENEPSENFYVRYRCQTASESRVGHVTFFFFFFFFFFFTGHPGLLCD